MLKDEAVALFPGKRHYEIAQLLGMTTIKFWPKKLDMQRADRIRGAAMRLGLPIPDHLLHCYYDENGKRVESEPMGRDEE